EEIAGQQWLEGMPPGFGHVSLQNTNSSWFFLPTRRSGCLIAKKKLGPVENSRKSAPGSMCQQSCKNISCFLRNYSWRDFKTTNLGVPVCQHDQRIAQPGYRHAKDGHSTTSGRWPIVRLLVHLHSFRADCR